MNLKDPFNRLSRREQNEYQALREQLRGIGIDSEEKANELLRQSRHKMLGYCLFVVVAAVASSLFVPEAMAITAVLSSLICLWLLTTLARGQKMIRQLIEEEFRSDDR